MKLNEQFITDTTEVFYHGTLAKTTTSDKSKANFPWYFITPSFMYALRYARKYEDSFGQIRKFNIKYDLDIFMAHDEDDLSELKSYLNLNGEEWESLKKDIVNSDWTKLGEEKRKRIVNAIQELGYDGFFNYEGTDLADAKYQFSEYYIKAPSIGLFDKDCLNQIGILTFDDFENESETYKKVHKMEKEYAQRELDRLSSSDMSADEMFEHVFQRCPTLVWDELYEDDDELADMFESIYQKANKARI